MPKVPNIDKLVNLHGLDRLEDSLKLGNVLVQNKSIIRVIPLRKMYPGEKAAEKKPKVIEVFPE